MLYSRLGDSGLIVSRLSFGTMTFTRGAGLAAIAKTELKDAAALFGRALDAGINFFDTADVYSDGESEEVLGQIIAGRRDEVVIATKAGWRMHRPLNRSGLSAAHLHWSIDHSLKRLGTDHVDIFIAHRDDVNTPLEETLQALDAIVRAGKARYLGYSNWPAWKVAAALELQRANGWAPFTHGQLLYSLVSRDIETELVPMSQRYGLGVTAWSPLGGGFLTGKYSRENMGEAGDRLAAHDGVPFDREKGFALLDRMREIAAGHGASVAQVALAWVLAKPAISSVIIGATKMHQLDDNLAAVNLALTPDEIAEMDALTAGPRGYPGFMIDRIDQPIAAALAARPGTPYIPEQA
ncbi:aldo/keto reductase [Sphingomonas sp. BT-65]|uniref:aldo/keto reductase n=1 Tax=Sphingomonas sp. BT-65 TaxID=2989821 RepID=UPI002236AFD0|nr:aldo/keto reductase [Sphingomonas sp. BT-65]MCW4463210.1 aldo/keto reductase [Sphingomonas sp. BT-65]